MKKSLFLYFLFLFALTQVVAQGGNNLIKTNVIPLVVGSPTLEYERIITNKITINTSISWRPKSNFPYQSRIETLMDIDDQDGILNNLKYGQFSITPEMRLYTRGDASKGFYIAPYLKYSRFSIGIEVPYSDLDQDSNSDEIIKLSGGMNAFTIGFGIGKQWHLGKSIYLDWRIIGVGYGFEKTSIAGNKGMDLQDQQDLKEILNDFEIPFIDFDYHVDARGAKVNFKSLFASLRTGLSIAYRF